MEQLSVCWAINKTSKIRLYKKWNYHTRMIWQNVSKLHCEKHNSLSVRYNRRLSLLLNTLLIFLKTLWIRNCKVAFNSWIQKYVFQYYFKNCGVESIQCTDSFLDQKRSLIIILPPKFHRYVHFNNDTQEFVRGPPMLFIPVTNKTAS